jgi:hypothetical protein
MREEQRRKLGQLRTPTTSLASSSTTAAATASPVTMSLPSEDDPTTFAILAKKHYFALRKIKDGKPTHAESIYRRIIADMIQSINDHNDKEDEEKGCDHAQLAVTTLLLALHLQRTGAPPQRTRSVFVNFVRVAVVGTTGTGTGTTTTTTHADHEEEHPECACSAKVLQAFALFEMKQGNQLKSLQLVQKAIQLDQTLQPILKWKQFRDAQLRRRSLLHNRRRRPQ